MRWKPVYWASHYAKVGIKARWPLAQCFTSICCSNIMLKYAALFSSCLLFLATLASCNEEDLNAVLLKSENLQNLDGAGQFQHEIGVSNGIQVKAQGNVNGIQGEYFLPGEDGKQIRVTYTADANGFHPILN